MNSFATSKDVLAVSSTTKFKVWAWQCTRIMRSSPANSLNFACKQLYLPVMLQAASYVCATRLSTGTDNLSNSSTIWFRNCSRIFENARLQKSICSPTLSDLLMTRAHKLNRSCFETPGEGSATKAYATLPLIKLMISNKISFLIISMSLFWMSLLMNVSFEPLPKRQVLSPFLLPFFFSSILRRSFPSFSRRVAITSKFRVLTKGSFSSDSWWSRKANSYLSKNMTVSVTLFFTFLFDSTCSRFDLASSRTFSCTSSIFLIDFFCNITSAIFELIWNWDSSCIRTYSNYSFLFEKSALTKSLLWFFCWPSPLHQKKVDMRCNKKRHCWVNKSAMNIYSFSCDKKSSEQHRYLLPIFFFLSDSTAFECWQGSCEILFPTTGDTTNI